MNFKDRVIAFYEACVFLVKNFTLWVKYQFNIGNAREDVNTEFNKLLVKINDVMQQEIEVEREYDEYDGIWINNVTSKFTEVIKIDNFVYRFIHENSPIREDRDFSISMSRGLLDTCYTKVISYKNDL